MTLTWKNQNAPYSLFFEDIYFNSENGIDESLHNFIQGNNLIERWRQGNDTVIAELGFGTGLNFMLTWRHFDQNKTSDRQVLHFISVEKYPLGMGDVEKALSAWSHMWGGKQEAFLSHYPQIPKGEWSIEFDESVTLTVVFDDVKSFFSGIDSKIDAWYMDGFAPAKNPDMWSEGVFQNMAGLSDQGTSFATFTSAGFVKRGLRKAGFDVHKAPGYGRKRERLVGEFKP